ncbi:hypothetical protein EMCG_09107 [[Emmonsia] crescens]|uniref:RNase MRP protein 1 RNA binding domain-containing protein n=1 Tax=[Emmonsia] crescens TaxID=73230 RepID=A0A0G2JA23_9EURO|nr:hypothetical protein EMCG_09107 [Emmonsia crescens UAMH 3008]
MPPQKPQKKRIALLPRSPTLKPIHTTLHLLYHRNKNQHGGAKWWKWLAMLKRSMGELVRAVRRWERVRDDDDDDEEEEEEEGGGGFRAKVLERMRYMHVWVVPRCYVALSTVVADKQFSALGVVLLAVLAQAAQAVAQVEEYHPPGQKECDTKTGNVLPATSAAVSTNRDENVDVDVGEVVKRSIYVLSPAADSASAGEREEKKAGGQKGKGKNPLILNAAEEGRKAGIGEQSKRESSLARLDKDEEDEGAARQKRKKPRTKRKKKMGDAIDDIFGGL